MDGYVLAWRWLAHAAVGGLIVLALGSLAARLCRQPVRRARVVVLTLAGSGSPCHGWALCPLRRGGPRASFWQLPRPGAVLGRDAGGSTPAAPPASIELPRGPVALEGGRAGLRWPVERPAREVADAGRRAGSWPSRLAAISWDAFALTAYAAVSAGLAAWWLLGQILLWRVTRAARPVPPEIHEVFREISGPAGRPVLLLESDTVDLPFTFTWARPVIVLPSGALRRGRFPGAAVLPGARVVSHRAP